MSNFIVNDCIGGYLYKFSKKQFPNPFMWTAIDFYDFLSLIKNYDTIDFEDILILWNKNDRRLFTIDINDKVVVRCPHWLFDIRYNKPTVVDEVNVRYNRIWLYIQDNYIRRLKRLKDSKEPPTFIMDFKEWLGCTPQNFQELLAESKNISYTTYVLVPFKEYDRIPFYKKDNLIIVYDKYMDTHTTGYRTQMFLKSSLFKV